MNVENVQKWKSTQNMVCLELASGSRAPGFGRANKLILTENETSIHLNDFQCNRTSNSNAKYQLNFNYDVKCHRFTRLQVQAISPSVSMATSGKPSTWFPLG